MEAPSTPVQVFRNSITFEVPGETPSRVTLSDSLSSYFKVSCLPEKILPKIRQDMLDGIYKTSNLLGYVNINPQEGFLHPALPDDNSSSLNCIINPGKVVSTLQLFSSDSQVLQVSTCRYILFSSILFCVTEITPTSETQPPTQTVLLG